MIKNFKYSICCFFISGSLLLFSHKSFAQQKIELSYDNFLTISFDDKTFSKEEKSKNQLLFKQFGEETSFNQKKLMKEIPINEKLPFYSFYIFKVPKNMDFLWFSARVTPISKETIATLNGISSSNQGIYGKELLVPTFNGVFVKEEPETSFEQLIFETYSEKIQNEKTLIFVIDDEKFYFLENEKFNSTLLLFFLDTNMYSPLKTVFLTSDFGYRISPVSGKKRFHNGIDLRAKEGTEVFCCKTGIVTFSVFDKTYGNCILIQHLNGLTSFYAHLSESFVQKNQKVQGGQIIGKTGNTGLSTGPHLHFELKKNGSPENPEKYLNF